MLQVTEDQLRLLHLDSAHTEIASWPLIALRRFGKDESKFTFECGRLVFDDDLVFLVLVRSFRTIKFEMRNTL